MNGPWGGRSRGENHAPTLDQRHREWPAEQAPAAPATREPHSGGELRPAEGTWCEKKHSQALVLCRMLRQPPLSGKCRSIRSPQCSPGCMRVLKSDGQDTNSVTTGETP